MNTTPRPRPRQPRHDPVRQRRQQMAKYILIANRVGYLMFAVAVATFVIGFAVGFKPAVAATVTVCLVLGTILLAPAIVMGYGVKAAEREDREAGR